ncbi:MAG: hypothetical protein IPP17_23720 [Bacteroidetes bacterium]|nr:hypothetical protein [Bacteroidota bacterium]
MADATSSISRPLAPDPSMDYQSLYLEGLKHIAALSGKIWTDYNAHDPGITILEVLCYAITDLGYRTDFDIGTIIEPSPGSTVLNDFFTLAQVASNAPLTITDYRKLLIDLGGIRNAWLEKVESPNGPVPELFLEFPPSPGKPHFVHTATATTQKIDIKGLYNVFLQFDVHPDFGDLNDNSLATTFWIKPIGQIEEKPFEVEIEFPVWEEISDEFDAIYTQVLSSTPGGGNVFELRLKDGLLTEAPLQPYVFEFTLEVNPNERAVELPMTLKVISGQEFVLNYNEFIARLKDEFLDTSIGVAPTYGMAAYDGGDFDDQQEIVQLILNFLRKRALIKGFLEDARIALAEHRNLCEDFDHVYPMSLQEIGLELELVVASGADCDAILAKVYHATENYLSPAIRSYSLREMLDKGYRPEEIFEGPWLCNGFIDSNEAQFTQRREILYTSDLLQEFMKIPGVEDVQSISLSRYLQGLLQESRRTECLCLVQPERFLPKLNYNFSNVRIDCGWGKFEEPDRQKALNYLSELKALEHLNGNAGRGDFDIPTNDYTNLEEFYSIQHEFPANFAIGLEGLAPDEPALRMAQAKQLKAYLLFFEQLLANFHSQLANVRLLFSYSDSINRTYFTQALFDVPRVKELIVDATGLTVAQYADYVNLPSSDPDHILNKVNALAENQDGFQDRRHRFLNHLLARFNESFSEYAAYVFSKKIPEADQYSKLIVDQSRFLRNYATDSLACDPNATDRRRGHSNDRGTAFNYQLPLSAGFVPDSYFALNNLQVEGLKKRMVYLTGLPKVEREYINPFERFTFSELSPNQWTFELMDDTGTLPAFVSVPGSFQATKAMLQSDLALAFPLSQDAANWVLNGGFWELRSDVTVPTSAIGIVDAGYLSTFGSATECIAALGAYLLELYSIENLHIIEHILLRPRANGDPTLPVRILSNCKALNIEDPYSFRISVVLPNWAGRFAEMDFRRLFKRLLRMEAPAHVYVHFYWIDPVQMYDFEHCWNEWLNGQWINKDLSLLWEIDNDLEVTGEIDKGLMLQENFYKILIERKLASGEESEWFVDCLGNLRNLADAYYVTEPRRIVDQWENCDVLAHVVDPDSPITGAWLAPDSLPLPPGVCLDICTGDIRVKDSDLLHTITQFDWPLVIATLSESGEVTYHSVTLQFIPNGPAVVSFQETNRHIDNFTAGQPLVQFTDPDGAIIMATFVTSYKVGSPNTVYSGMPPGMTLDLINGTIAVGDPLLLIVGTFVVQVNLMDDDGGETLLTVTIVIEPDKEAVGVALTPITKNQDAYSANDIVAKISDADGDLVTVVERLGTTSLASLGLALQLTTGSPVEAEVYISHLPTFTTALGTLFTLSGATYNKTIKLKTEDEKHGKSDVDILLTIRRDNPPVFAGVPPVKSVDQLVAGTLVGTISETLDMGIASFTPPVNLASMGLTITQVGNQLQVKVSDQAAFTSTMNSSIADSNLIATLTFQVGTVDNTGGIGVANCTIQARLDQEPTVDYAPVKNVDQYLKHQVLAWIKDADGTGIVTATQVGGTLLADLGLKMVVGAASGYPGTVARIEIEFWNQFVNAVSYSPYFTVINATTNLVRAVVNIATTDSLGGKGNVPVNIDARRDIEATILAVLNGQRVNTYVLNDVLFRFQDNDPNTNFTTYAFDTALPAGLGMRLVLGQYEIYVSNPALLVAGSYPRTVTLMDNQGGKTTLAVPILILKRLVAVSFTVTASSQSHLLNLAPKVYGLQVISFRMPLFPKSFGTVSKGNGIELGFTEGTGFATSTLGQTVSFNGTIGAELVEGTLTITRRQFVVVNPGGGKGNVTAVFGGNVLLNGSSNLGNEKSLTLTNSTGKLVFDLQNATQFPDNPQLRTNPALVEAYANGSKDGDVTQSLGGLLVETMDEIVRLQSEILKKGGSANTQTRAQLAVYVEIYRQQVVAATNFAADVRTDDLSTEVEGLFDLIHQQNSRIL